MKHTCDYDSVGGPCRICGLTAFENFFRKDEGITVGGAVSDTLPVGVIEVDANLLEYPLDGFIHQANCFKTMGGGIALRIKQKYPELYEADKTFTANAKERLGSFSTVKCHDDKQGYNMYGQYDFGYNNRHTNYEAVYTGLLGIAHHARENNVLRLGLPKHMGCRLGGGSWNIVRAIIDDIFTKKCGIALYICNYDG